MSKLKEPPAVKLFIALIYSERLNMDQLIDVVNREIGAIDYSSNVFEFTSTDYYSEEMGIDLKRQVLSLAEPVKREQLVDLKILTNDIEKRFCDSSGNRTVNLDPGYIAPEHLILATGKGYYHRPYLGKGVYADLTLVYQNNNFKILEWTYPDYKLEHMQEIFMNIRDIYMKQRGKEII